MSDTRLEHLEACLLGGYEEGDVYGRTCGLPWHPGDCTEEMVQEREGEEIRKRKAHELVIDPTGNSLNRRTQHFMQPNVYVVHPFRSHLWIDHRFPFQHPSDPPLPTNVFTQRVCVECVRSDLLIVGTGIQVWTRVEEHEKISMEDPTTYVRLRFIGSDIPSLTPDTNIDSRRRGMIMIKEKDREAHQ